MEEKEVNLFHSLKCKPRISLADELFQQLKEMIVSGQLKPGDCLPSEASLCENLNVGRSTVREALKALTTLDFIVRTKKGTFVNDTVSLCSKMPFQEVLNYSDVKDILELRQMLEIGIVRLAAQRSTKEDIDKMSESIEQLEKNKNSLEGATYYDMVFHAQLATASQNEAIVHILEAVRESIQNSIYTLFEKEPAIVERAIKHHKKILKALEQSDDNKAEEAMKNHILDVITTHNQK